MHWGGPGEVVYEHQSFCLVPFAFSPLVGRVRRYLFKKRLAGANTGSAPIKQVISPGFRWLTYWYIKNSFLTPLWRSLDRSSQPLTRHSSARRLVRQWKFPEFSASGVFPFIKHLRNFNALASATNCFFGSYSLPVDSAHVW